MTRMIEARRPTEATTSREQRAVQVELRATEREARRTAVTAARLGGRLGHGRQEMARRLGLSRRTLVDWDPARGRRRVPRPRGRPCARIPRRDRQDVVTFLSVVGPRVSLASLRASFPEFPPAALADLRERFRFVRKRRDRWLIRTLEWLEPGWVWALDFAEPPNPIDGEFPYLLLVRDLASGMQLARYSPADQVGQRPRVPRVATSRAPEESRHSLPLLPAGAPAIQWRV